LDTSCLESGGDLGKGLRVGPSGTALEISDRLLGDFGVLRKVVLRPVKQRASGTALRIREGH
jgi:hypothetical protein